MSFENIEVSDETDLYKNFDKEKIDDDYDDSCKEINEKKSNDKPENDIILNEYDITGQESPEKDKEIAEVCQKPDVSKINKEDEELEISNKDERLDDEINIYDGKSVCLNVSVADEINSGSYYHHICNQTIDEVDESNLEEIDDENETRNICDKTIFGEDTIILELSENVSQSETPQISNEDDEAIDELSENETEQLCDESAEDQKDEITKELTNSEVSSCADDDENLKETLTDTSSPTLSEEEEENDEEGKENTVGDTLEEERNFEQDEILVKTPSAETQSKTQKEFAIDDLAEVLENLQINTQEPWPKDVKLFQPYEVEQILLPDNANCLAVQAFLKMCNLDFQVEPRANAEAMSPSGKVPFIKAGAFVISELEPIVQFINNKGITLTEKLDPEMKSDMRAYMSLIHSVLEVAELYICWCDKETYNEVTSIRHGSIYPWPLNHIQNRAKKASVIKKLKVLEWYQKSMAEVYQEVESCCQALTDRLEGKDYFFGDKPTELDALVFGHLFTILTTPLPNSHMANTVRNYPILINLVQRIERDYFKRETKH